MSKPLILLVGKSGSGKNYFINKMNWMPVVSYTTRPKRIGEVNGIEHWFVSNLEYELANKFEFVAYTYFSGYHYWANLEQCMDFENDVYIIDSKGIDYFKERMKDFQPYFNRNITIWYLDVPLLQRIKNMRTRGDSWGNVLKRVKNDFIEFMSVKEKVDIVMKWNNT